MLPRKKLDIGWADLASALAMSLRPGGADRASRLEALWSPEGRALATLSVRSGFDLVLRQLALPAGSEVLVSAVTIRDMVAIIEAHGLRAVPVDIDPDTCALRVDRLRQAIGGRTRALLVAHLFGSRTPMDAVAAVADRHGLFLFEDCAQAFAADGYTGHPRSDVTMFSFGPIKTATALGGGVLVFRERDRCEDARRRQRAYPPQRRGGYARRVLKYGLLKALSWRAPYTVFATLCRWSGSSHDRVIANAVRGFGPGALLVQLRRRPGPALLGLMLRRHRRYGSDDLADRIAAATALAARLPADAVPGRWAQPHCHWLLPLQCDDPDVLVARLQHAGFDATRGATSLHAVPAGRDAAADGAAPMAAQRMMSRMLYLPVESASGTELRELARIVGDFLDRPPPVRTGP